LPTLPRIVLLPSEITEPLLLVIPDVVLRVIVLPDTTTVGLPPLPLKMPCALLAMTQPLTVALTLVSSVVRPPPRRLLVIVDRAIVAVVFWRSWIELKSPPLIRTLSTISVTLPAVGFEWMPMLKLFLISVSETTTRTSAPVSIAIPRPLVPVPAQFSMTTCSIVTEAALTILMPLPTVELAQLIVMFLMLTTAPAPLTVMPFWPTARIEDIGP
jgi:hypothetical protein